MDTQPQPAKPEQGPTLRFRRFVAQACADERGVTAVEYGLLAALIVVVAMAAIATTGTATSDIFTYWSDAVSAAL